MEAMITRLLGVILAALAVQFVVDGIKRSSSRRWRGAGARRGRRPHHPPHPVGRIARQWHRRQPGRHPAAQQLHVEAVRRLRPVDGRFRHVRADQQIIDMIKLRRRPGIGGIAAPGAHHVDDLGGVAVIGAGDGVMVRHRDQAGPEVDEAHHHAARLAVDRPERPQARAAAAGEVDRASIGGGRLRAAEEEPATGEADDDQQDQRDSADAQDHVSLAHDPGEDDPGEGGAAGRAEQMGGRAGAGLPERARPCAIAVSRVIAAQPDEGLPGPAPCG